MSRLLTEGVWAESAVGVVRVDTPLSLLPLHVRGGMVTPLQQPAANSKISRSNPFEFLGQYCIISSSLHCYIAHLNIPYAVALDEDEAASGSVFYDDGESLKTVEKGEYFLGEVTMIPGGRNIHMTVVKDDYRGVDSLSVERVIVLGLRTEVVEVSVNYEPHHEWTFEAGGLMINNLTLSLNENFLISI